MTIDSKKELSFIPKKNYKKQFPHVYNTDN